MNESIKQAIGILLELEDDLSIPKNIRLQLKKIIETLRSGEDISIKFSKVFQVLEEISEDPNLDSYTRTQIMNVSGILESKS
ncbi:MAG: UPF0147 family protein [Candidatus Woesearchaeota archaeon]